MILGIKEMKVCSFGLQFLVCEYEINWSLKLVWVYIFVLNLIFNGFWFFIKFLCCSLCVVEIEGYEFYSSFLSLIIV